jgi:hypothetical protein
VTQAEGFGTDDRSLAGLEEEVGEQTRIGRCVMLVIGVAGVVAANRCSRSLAAAATVLCLIPATDMTSPDGVLEGEEGLTEVDSMWNMTSIRG